MQTIKKKEEKDKIEENRQKDHNNCFVGNVM